MTKLKIRSKNNFSKKSWKTFFCIKSNFTLFFSIFNVKFEIVCFSHFGVVVFTQIFRSRIQIWKRNAYLCIYPYRLLDWIYFFLFVSTKYLKLKNTEKIKSYIKWKKIFFLIQKVLSTIFVWFFGMIFGWRVGNLVKFGKAYWNFDRKRAFKENF